jgi:hypothetical protein
MNKAEERHEEHRCLNVKSRKRRTKTNPFSRAGLRRGRSALVKIVLIGLVGAMAIAVVFALTIGFGWLLYHSADIDKLMPSWLGTAMTWLTAVVGFPVFAGMSILTAVATWRLPVKSPNGRCVLGEAVRISVKALWATALLGFGIFIGAGGNELWEYMKTDSDKAEQELSGVMELLLTITGMSMSLWLCFWLFRQLHGRSRKELLLSARQGVDSLFAPLERSRHFRDRRWLARLRRWLIVESMRAASTFGQGILGFLIPLLLCIWFVLFSDASVYAGFHGPYHQP